MIEIVFIIFLVVLSIFLIGRYNSRNKDDCNCNLWDAVKYNYVSDLMTNFAKENECSKKGSPEYVGNCVAIGITDKYSPNEFFINSTGQNVDFQTYSRQLYQKCIKYGGCDVPQ